MYSSSDTTRQILQILLTYSSNINGARALLKLDLEEISPLLEISLQEPSVLDIIRHAFMNAVRGDDSSKDSANSRLDGIISALIRSFRNADPTNLFDFLESLVTELPSSVCQSQELAMCFRMLTLLQMLYPAPWLLSLISMIHQTLTRAQTDAVDTIRTSAVALAATLLSLYKDKAAVLLFSSSGNQPSSSSGKPTVYLLIKLVIVDIHATIPALEDSRISPGFNNTFKRLAASYDVVVSFIGYLFRLLDEEDTADLPLSSDLILRLRSDIAESISITIEFIKDHFDRVHGKQGAFKSTLLLPPPASGHVLQQDPELDLLAAQVRLLAIWLREDDNEKLRTEAIHIIPVLLQLYTPSSSADSAHDVRFPVLGALQGIVSQPEGAESFFENGGWEVLSGDFLPILELVFRSQRENPEEQDRVRALEVIRVLLAAIESQSSSVAQFRDDWLTLLPLSLASDKSTRQITSGELELLIAAWQLAVEILSRAPCPARAESSDEAKRMAQLAKGYLTMPDLDEGNKEGLQEVLAGLAEVFPRL